MKRTQFWLATRFFKHQYFQQHFITHYLELGADKIFAFVHPDDHGIVELNIGEYLKKGNVVLVSDFVNRPDSYRNDRKMCQDIYEFCLEKAQLFVNQGEKIVLGFFDEDEFLQENPLDAMKSEDLLYSVMVEWYLSPPHRLKKIPAQELFNAMNNRELKCKVLELWNDPYYKTPLLKISSENLEKWLNLLPMGGFHRMIDSQKLFDPPHKKSIYVHHLKGIPLAELQFRLKYRLELTSNQDDWVYVHNLKEYDNLILNYDEYYEKLGYLANEESRLKKLLEDRALHGSYFEQNIVYQNLTQEQFSKPSTHLAQD